jgi:predicted site-specific integrase-resolvase
MEGTQYIRLREFAQRVGVSVDVAERWVNARKVRVMRIGGQIVRPARVHVSEVDRILSSGIRRPKRSVTAEPDTLGIYAERGR